jgi:hypothetical protein
VPDLIEWRLRARFSTRRVEKPAENLGVTQLSKSQVSAMAKHLDEQVAAFRYRPLDQVPYTFGINDPGDYCRERPQREVAMPPACGGGVASPARRAEDAGTLTSSDWSSAWRFGGERPVRLTTIAADRAPSPIGASAIVPYPVRHASL